MNTKYTFVNFGYFILIGIVVISCSNDEAISEISDCDLNSEFVLLETKEWDSISILADDNINFKIPHSFKILNDTSFIYYHGGRDWIDIDSTIISEKYGVWGEDSFITTDETIRGDKQQLIKECRISKWDVHLNITWDEQNYSGIAWIKGLGYGYYDILFSVESNNRESINIFLSSITSLNSRKKWYQIF